MEDVSKAKAYLRDAIELHQDHMDGFEPTTGPAGERSQRKMMDLMRKALEALGGRMPGGM